MSAVLSRPRPCGTPAWWSTLFEFIEVLLHAFSFQMCVGVSVQRETKAATTVIVKLREIWKISQKSYKKKNTQQQRECACGLREERSDSEVADWNEILFSMAGCTENTEDAQLIDTYTSNFRHKHKSVKIHSPFWFYQKSHHHVWKLRWSFRDLQRGIEK